MALFLIQDGREKLTTAFLQDAIGRIVEPIAVKHVLLDENKKSLGRPSSETESVCSLSEVLFSLHKVRMDEK